MGNIADQLPVLFFVLGVLLGGFLQPQPHILIIVIQVAYLALDVCLQSILEISLFYFPHGNIQLVDRVEYSPVYPLGQR